MNRITHENAHADNAMTEVALALAMAFFSIMVLTIVSMGAGQEKYKASIGEKQQINIINSGPVSHAVTIRKTKKQNLIVYYQGHYFDSELKRINPNSFNSEGRAVLALNPELSVSEAMLARAPFSVPDLTVTTLTDDWLQRLKVLD